jgi:hypothetical protein
LLQVLDCAEVGDNIPETPEFRDVLSALERFIPEVLEEVHPYWKGDSLDGVLPVFAQKIAPRTVSIFGQCIIMKSQAYEPLRVSLQVNASGECVNWFDCKLIFDRRKGKTRYRNDKQEMAAFYSSDGHTDLIDYRYHVAFGTKED